MPLPVLAPVLPEIIPSLPVPAPVLPVPVVAPPPVDAPELWPLVPVPTAQPTEAARLTAAATANSDRRNSNPHPLNKWGEGLLSDRIFEMRARFSTFPQTQTLSSSAALRPAPPH